MATIRKSSIKDLDNIAEIENSSFSKPWSIEQLRATISKIFIAEEKKEIKKRLEEYKAKLREIVKRFSNTIVKLEDMEKSLDLKNTPEQKSKSKD